MTLFNPLDFLKSIIDEAVNNISRFSENPGKDFTRNRQLPVRKLLKFILEAEGNSINAELFKSFPTKKERMTASAFIQQRDKLKAEIFLYILRKLNEMLDHSKKYKGYNIYAIDGTDLYFPANPESECFVKNKKRCQDGSDAKDYCLLHANIIYDVLNKQYIDCITGPKHGYGGNERIAAAELLNQYSKKKTITVMDRGYVSYNMIEHGNRCGGYYMIRSLVHNGAIAEIAKLPDAFIDEWVTVRITTVQKKKYLENGYKLLQVIRKHYKDESEMHPDTVAHGKKQWDFEEACEVRFRIVKFRINDTGKDQWEVVVTNLPSHVFSMEDIKKLYAMRWGIETSFRNLKYAVGAIQFHSKQDKYIKQELYAHLVMYNIVTACGRCVKIPRNPKYKYEYAVDFKMTVTVVRKYFREDIESFFRLCSEISEYIQPIRPGRKDPRRMRPKEPIYFIYRIA